MTSEHTTDSVIEAFLLLTSDCGMTYHRDDLSFPAFRRHVKTFCLAKAHSDWPYFACFMRYTNTLYSMYMYVCKVQFITGVKLTRYTTRITEDELYSKDIFDNIVN